MDDVFNLKSKKKHLQYWPVEQFVVTNKGEHRILKLDRKATLTYGFLVLFLF